MKRFILNCVSLWVIDLLFENILIVDGTALIALTLILSLCNTLVKPILGFFSLPLTILTLGLFSLVVNGIVFLLAFSFVPGAMINGLMTAIFASILLSIVNSVLTDMFKN